MLKNMTVDGTRTDTRKVTVLAVILLLFTITLAVCAAGVSDADTTPTIEFDSPTLDLNVGETAFLTIEVTTSYTGNPEWKSDKPGIATVTGTGETVEIEAKSYGVAKITASVKYNDGSAQKTLTATCTVTVAKHLISIEVKPASTNLAPGGTITLSVTYDPADTTEKGVTWSSQNNDVATVDQSGKVTAVKEGNVRIIATSTKGGISDYCQLTVSSVKVSSVSIKNAPSSVNVNQSITLQAEVLPANATDKSVTWSSDNTNVLTVSSTGVVNGISAGTARVTVTTVGLDASGKACTATATIEVKTVPTTGIEITPEQKTIEVDDEFRPTVNVKPAEATDKSVTWRSSDIKIATVSENGTITGVSPGKATITATTVSGGFSASINIIVDTTYTLTIRPAADGSLSDGQLEQINAAVSAAESKRLNLIVEMESTTDTVKFPSSIVGKVMKERGSLELTTRNGSIVIPSGGLDSIDVSATTVGFSVKTSTLPEKFSELNPAYVVDVSMLAGDTPVTTIFAPTDVTVGINHILSSDEKAEDLRVVYIDEEMATPIPAIWYGYEEDTVWFGSYHLSTYAYFFHDAQIGANSVLLFSCIFAVIMVVLTILIFLYVRSVDGFKGMFKLKQDNGQQRPPKYPPQQPPSYNNPYNYR